LSRRWGVAKKTSQPGAIHLRIIEVMKRFPGGVSGGQIRQELKNNGVSPEDLYHLGRRIAELDEWFVIERVTPQQAPQGEEPRLVAGGNQISRELRAQVLYAARGRCQMCGRTIEVHRITLAVQHKKLRDWDRTDDRENLWAICEECDAGMNATLHRAEIAGARPRLKGSRCRSWGESVKNEL
jgi:5-methylcytosine-specific restriction endonuclease McrA